MRRLSLSLLATCLGMTVLSSAAGVAGAATGGSTDRTSESAAGHRVATHRLTSPARATGVAPPSRLGAGLTSASGRQRVVVELAEAPVARAAGRPSAAQRAQASRVTRAQSAVLDAARALDPAAVALGRTRVALSSVLLDMDAGAARRLALDPRVAAVRSVVDHRLDLSDTVPYIGADRGAATGLDGDGVTVAVLDSGIDYTHAKLGGAGTDAAYERAYGASADITEPDLAAVANTLVADQDGAYFPTAKVVAGYDFVGEAWPDFGPEVPDPNPIDLEGHGTHVADIIAGQASAGASDDGVAPSADLYGIRVCASFSPACSGIALLQGLDYALDPNGDGDLADAADVVNMSLGSDYGSAPDDSLSAAVDNASAAGTLTVASAGNGGNRPFVTGTPAAAPTALSVAQTNTPGARLAQLEVTEPAAIAGPKDAVFQPWSVAPDEVVGGPVQYGDGAGGNLDGCAPFPDGSLEGLVVLVDRGECSVSFKIAYISDAGGALGLVGLITPDAPFEFGFGGLPDDAGDIEIPAYAISQADAEDIRAQLGAGEEVQAEVDPSAGIPLIGTTVGSTSRGPSMVSHLLKPEIAAPGASVSAEAGTGVGTTSFGGTSGAAPMVSGAAALVVQATPGQTPLEVKARLMNTAETEIREDPASRGGALSPVSRIGAGEVRVDRAVGAPAVAFDSDNPSGGLSFGFPEVTETTTFTRNVTVRNPSPRPITYVVDADLRYDDDADLGAVDIATPARLVVPARGEARFDVGLTIDPVALRRWRLDSGANGANGPLLTELELDGFVTLAAVGGNDDARLQLPFQVLARPAADVTTPATRLGGGLRRGPVEVVLDNDGAVPAGVDAYTLLGSSPRQAPEDRAGADDPLVDLKAVGSTTVPVPAGVCGEEASFVLALAASTYDRQTHADVPAAFEFGLDLDGDPAPDVVVFNADLSVLTTGANDLSVGQNAAIALDVETGEASAFFLTDHGTNSANTVLLTCAEQLGLDGGDIGRRIRVDVNAVDIYFTGAVTDSIRNLRLRVGREGFTAPSIDVPAGGQATLEATVTRRPSTYGSGLLLLLDAVRFDDEGEYRTGTPVGRESIVLAGTGFRSGR